MQQLEIIFWQRNKDICILEQHQQITSFNKKIAHKAQQLSNHTNISKKHLGDINTNSDGQKQMSSKNQTIQEQTHILPKKYQFQQKQRQRIQRENWILKIIKSVQNINEANRQNIYSIVLKIMKYFEYKTTAKTNTNTINIQAIKNNITNSTHSKLQGNYQQLCSQTESTINLFITFYSQYRISQLPTIKKIIRPNNKFVIFDLLKQLVETHRQYFRVKLLETFKNNINNSKKNANVSENIMSPLPQSDIQQQTNSTKNRKQKLHVKSTLTKDQQKAINILFSHRKYLKSLSNKLKNISHQYHIAVLNNSIFPSSNSTTYNISILKYKMNQLYSQLLENNRNTAIQYTIMKHYQKCQQFAYGVATKNNSSKINNNSYDMSKLYTQQQIKDIYRNLQKKVGQGQSMIKGINAKIKVSVDSKDRQLSSDNLRNHANTNILSVSKLRQYFKITLEVQLNYQRIKQAKLLSESTVKMNQKKSRNLPMTINQWLPFIIRKSLNQYQIYVIFNKQSIVLGEFENKYGLGIKNYLKIARKNYHEILSQKALKKQSSSKITLTKNNINICLGQQEDLGNQINMKGAELERHINQNNAQVLVKQQELSENNCAIYNKNEQQSSSQDEGSYEQQYEQNSSIRKQYYKQQEPLNNIKKHKFFSINQSKTKQLLSDQVISRLYSDPTKKKQSIFPILRQNQLKQQQYMVEVSPTKKPSLPSQHTLHSNNGNNNNIIIVNNNNNFTNSMTTENTPSKNIRNKSMSDNKLAPLFRNQIVNKKLDGIGQYGVLFAGNPNNKIKTMVNLSEEQSPYQYTAPNISSYNERNNNKSLQHSKNSKNNRSNSLNNIKSVENVKIQRKIKIDNIIQSIINQRNLGTTYL